MTRLSRARPLRSWSVETRLQLYALSRRDGYFRRMLLRAPSACVVVVARRRGQLVGWAAADRFGRDVLLGVFVGKPHRGKGIGVELARAVYRSARRRWPRRETIARPSCTAGRRMYRRLGFGPVR